MNADDDTQPVYKLELLPEDGDTEPIKTVGEDTVKLPAATFRYTLTLWAVPLERLHEVVKLLWRKP